MFLVEIDKTRNLLHYTIAETFDEADGKKCLETVRRALEDLQPGFVILTDVRYLQSIDPAAMHYVKEIMNISNAKGVSRIVRIVPKSTEDFGLNVLSVFHYDRSIPIVMCRMFEEAVRLLPESDIATE